MSGIFVLLVLLLCAGTLPVGAQVGVGGAVSLNRDLADESTFGFGVRGRLGVPLTGLAVQGTMDFYQPDCGGGDCDFRDAGINLLWSLPVPVLLSPYVGAGLAIQDSDRVFSERDETEYGLNALAGVVLQGATFERFRPFGEVKYQFMKDFDDQLVFAAGILVFML